MIKRLDLPEEIVALGLLAGLLTKQDDEFGIDLSWFEQPFEHLRGIGGRIEDLVDFLAPLLGAPVASFADAQWYSIVDPRTGQPTIFHLVSTKASAGVGEIGLGVLHQLGIAALDARIFLQIPLFGYDANGVRFLPAVSGHPCRIGVDITASERGQLSFSSARINATLGLTDGSATIAFEIERPGNAAPEVYGGLEGLCSSAALKCLAEILDGSLSWLAIYVSPTQTARDILVAAGFLKVGGDQDSYTLAIEQLRGSSAGEIASSFAWAVLDALAVAEIALIGLPGGGIYFDHEPDTGEYGIRVSGTLVRDSPETPAGSRQPKLGLVLGAWLSGEGDADNWLSRAGRLAARSGVMLHLLRRDAQGKISLEPRLELCSVGIDIDGAAGQPLFNTNGYQLQGLQSRAYFSWKAGSTPEFGAAIQLKEIGIPLGPKAGGEAGSSNPVAANLLGSGDSAEDDKADAGNPTFSAVVAYAGTFYGKVFSDMPSADGKAWIPINRSFGPLHCRQIGLGFNNEERLLGIGYDGGVALGPLGIDLDHLTIDIPLQEPQNFSRYKLGLAGLDVSYAGGPISISGGFFKNEVVIDGLATTQYDGVALIKAADFTVTGFGSYAVIANDASLFIFAILHKDLGGPPCFRVNGLAAGFGYNRKLKLPPIEEVQRFPLVCAALDENYFSSQKAVASPAGSSADPQDVIEAAMVMLRDYIPPSHGDYWFAAGVRFSSFEMIQSFALLSVSFGHEVEIGLLGMSKMSVPKGASPGSEVAYAELTLRAVIKPDEGTVAVEGRLTDNSYLFSRDCRLTGGFAFYLWSTGEHAGDFVVTLGGYHPRFVRPSHYPIVPRLGVHWQVSSDLTVTAEMYYALTPSCLMAGGRISAVFQSGGIKAWYTAYADFLLSWKPFYYLVDMGISIGVEATARIPLGFAHVTMTIKVELSVDLHLWGPPFSGEVYVDLTVISFTIPFGDPRTSPAPLTADEFAAAFLPAPKAPDVFDVISVRINSGLLQQREKDNDILRVVNGHALSLTAESLVPSTRFAGLAEAAKYKQPQNKRPSLSDSFGIRPMARQTLTSAFDVRLKGLQGQYPDQGNPENLRASFVENGVPDALWGRCAVAGEVALPGNPEAKIILATVGVRFSFLPIDPEHALFAIPLEKLKLEQLPTKTVVWLDPGETPRIGSAVDKTFWSTIWGNAEVDAQRNAILDVLRAQSPFLQADAPQLGQLQRSERAYFQADPEFCALGEQLT